MVKQIHKHAKALAVGVSCAGIAAGAGAIGAAGAATSHSQTHARAHARMHARAALRPGGHPGGPPPGPPAVHGQLVVPTKSGFDTVTFDRGEIKSVSGQQLVLTEGTPKRTYKTVTLTIPANAVVKLDGKSSALDSLKTGEHAMVVQGPNKTAVLARDSAAPNPHGNQAPPAGQGRRGGPGGQGAPGGQGGQGGSGQGGQAGSQG